MGRYGRNRLLEAVVTLLILSLVVFLSVRLTGDPAAYLLGPEGTTQDYEQLKKNMGLDRPLIVQYVSFLYDIARGDFGRSLITGRPVGDMLFERVPATAQLALAAFGITLSIGIPLGVLSAVRRDSFLDLFTKLFAVLGTAAPGFWVGIMLIFLFAAILGWLPAAGAGDLKHLLLPAFVLGWHGIAGMLRLARSSMLEELDTDYVKYARAKGLAERAVIFRHALRNAVIPLITYSGLLLAGLLNGAVVAEVVFAWPGVGRLLLQGINQRDFPVVQAGVLLAGFTYVLSAFLVDMVYAYVNPRIRFGG